MSIHSDIGPFGIVPRWVRLVTAGSPWALMLYATLADKADRSEDGDGGWTCSRQSLAEEMGTSIRTMARAQAVLVEEGALEVENCYVPGTQELGWSRYFVKAATPVPPTHEVVTPVAQLSKNPHQ